MGVSGRGCDRCSFRSRAIALSSFLAAAFFFRCGELAERDCALKKSRIGVADDSEDKLRKVNPKPRTSSGATCSDSQSETACSSSLSEGMSELE